MPGDLFALSKEFTTNFSLLLTGITTDSDWNEEDRLRIEGHKPLGALLLNKRCGVLHISVPLSRTGVVDLEDGEAGVEGLDGDGDAENLDEGVVGLRLSADWDLLGSDNPVARDVCPAFGEGYRLGELGVETGVDDIPDLYREATLRGLRVAETALFLSEGSNNRL